MARLPLIWISCLAVCFQLSDSQRLRCPRPYSFGACVSTCSSDTDCSGSMKCCSIGCGSKCERPVEDAATIFSKPDFVSNWLPMTASADTATTFLEIDHHLGETPLLVDIQVKVPDGTNVGYIFPGSGSRIRDDDKTEGYGGTIYLYNDVHIQISCPKAGNDNLGQCIYTGIEPFWTGAAHVSHISAQVRARAWKASSLPVPNYEATGIDFSARLGTVNYFQQSVHNLGTMPSMFLARVKFPSDHATAPNYYSDSVDSGDYLGSFGDQEDTAWNFILTSPYLHFLAGASRVFYDSRSSYKMNGYVVYGFSDTLVRAWAPTISDDYLFRGGDGWNFDTVATTTGELEFYGWTPSTLIPSVTSYLAMGPSATQFSGNFNIDVENTFTSAWVQADGGNNDAFRFPGVGSVGYHAAVTAAGCSFGGLAYAYRDTGILFWQPGAGNGVSNGALICIADDMGDGNKVQASSTGTAHYNVWTLDDDDCMPGPCVNGRCINQESGYACVCDSGYDGVDCDQDVNECTLGTDNCNTNAGCTNTVGSFSCTCNAGYSGDGVSCADVNECTLGTDNCNTNAGCANTVGSFSCTCNAGYSGDGVSCADVNECTLGTDNCNTNAGCTNTAGSFSCTCNAGYSGDGVSCADVNECTLGTDNCNTNAGCTNTVGSFSCTCNAGYSGDGVSCADIDECSGTHACDTNAVCGNNIGSYDCFCKVGYNGDGFTCADDNECSDGTHGCDANAGCTNVPGSFSCACNSGYSGDGFSCSDVNECTLGTDNCNTNAGCANTVGSFSCTCNAGYSGDGVSCADVNECQLDTDNCHTNAGCTNTVGSFSCACNSGYSGNGVSCSDVDECTDGTDNCDTNADCTNTIGNFQCTCNSGYSGNGVTCSDVDECTANTHNCHRGANCTNTDGSFTCACDKTRGFYGEGVTCSHVICNPDNSIDIYELPANSNYYAMQDGTKCTVTDINSTAITLTGCSKDEAILLTYGSYSAMETYNLHGGRTMTVITITCNEVPASGNIHEIANSLAADLTLDEERTINPTYDVTSTLSTASTTVGSTVTWTISFPSEYILEVTECKAYPGTDATSSENVVLITKGGCYSEEELIDNFTDNLNGTASTDILAFKFYVSNNVFLSCDVRICPAGSTQCDTGCSRQKRSILREARELDEKVYSAKIHDVLQVYDLDSSAAIPGASVVTISTMLIILLTHLLQ